MRFLAGRLRLAQLFLAGAVVIDCYLAWVSLSGGATAGCGPASDCHTVLSSRWAFWFGVPVSAPALGVYAILLLTTYWLGQSSPSGRHRPAWHMAMAAAISVLAAALWFIVLQLFVLRAICPYCMAAHICGALGSLMILTQAPLRGARADVSLRVARSERALVAVVAAASLAILIAGQLFQRPKTYVSKPIAAGLSTNELAPATREFRLFDGKYRLELNEVPLVGNPRASHILVGLFDYTCDHCRAMHRPLVEAVHRFSNELAMITLPVPLDPKCNPILKRTLARHVNACALARLGLTVWRANPKAAAAFDEWVFGPVLPPSPAAVEEYARKLVGNQAFDQAATNTWINQQIEQDISIYESVYRQTHQGNLPEVIIGTNVISGTFNGQQLDQALAEGFNLRSN